MTAAALAAVVLVVVMEVMMLRWGPPRAKDRSGSLLSVVSTVSVWGTKLLGTFPCCDTDLVGVKMVEGFKHALLKKRASNIIPSRYLAALTGLSYVNV